MPKRPAPVPSEGIRPGSEPGDTVAPDDDEDFVDLDEVSSFGVLDDIDELAEDDDLAQDHAPMAYIAEAPIPKFAQVSADVAQSLRLYDSFPDLPEPARSAGLPQAVEMKICVSRRGDVDEITMDHRAAASLEEVLMTAIRSWRYRPLVVGGKATPFCHDLQIRYASN